MKRLAKILLVLITLLIVSKPGNASAGTVVTWDTNNKGANVDLYDGNMTVGGKGGYGQNVTATGSGYSSGRYYWEVTTSANNCSTGSSDGFAGVNSTSGSVNAEITVRSEYFSLCDNIPNNDYIDGNSTISFLLDLDNHLLYVKNGTYAKQYILQSGTTYKPAISISGNDLKVTANFGATPFKYSIPSGYSSYSGGVKPTAPSNLIVDNQTNTNITLKWNAVENATSYYVKRSETPGGDYDKLDSSVISLSGSTISYIDKNVTSGKTYYYVVSAVVSGTESTNSNEVSVTLIKPASVLKLVLEVNQNQQLSVFEDLDENLNVTWTSSDTSVATVDANGVVKALKVGNALITCTSSDGSYTETIKIIVVKTIQLAVNLVTGKTCRLTVDDLANTVGVTWVSGDSTVATVSSTGKVTAVGKGLVLITAIDENGNEIDHIYIRVGN